MIMSTESKTNNEEFERNGYLVVRDFYDISSFVEKPPPERGTKTYISSSNYVFVSSNQVSGALSIYGDPRKKYDHSQIRLKLEKILGKELYNTYYYERFYFPNQELDKHTDRDACEISISIHISTDIKTPWPFMIETPDQEEHSVILNPGDGVIYKGRERPHWRDKIPSENKKQYYHQIFFHYVLANGNFVSSTFDRRTV